jgi:hypothetical protein
MHANATLGVAAPPPPPPTVAAGGRAHPASLPRAPRCPRPQKYEPYSRQATFKQLLREPIAAGGQAAQLGFRRLQAVLQVCVCGV